MKIRTLLASVAALSLVVSLALAAEKEFKAACPVSNKPAKQDNFVKFEGAKVYFCCQGCPKKFKADSAKYSAKAHMQMLQTGQVAQVACPMTGKKLNPNMTVQVGDQNVMFCCGGCKAKVRKAEDKVATVFSTAAFKKGFTHQTLCPVSGKPINANIMVEHDGRKVYFCCKGCPKKFQANPEKYLDKLPKKEI